MRVLLGGYLWRDRPCRMDPAQVLALYESFAGDRLTFLYSGSFHDDHTARLIALVEEYLEGEGAPRVMRGRLAFIMVEAYQNIVRHRSLGAEVGVGRSLFLLRSRGNVHEVTAMNAVGEEDERRLSAALQRLSDMDHQEMKRSFLKGLQSDARTTRGGAGLGLLEMARRSGNPLRHSFTPIGDGRALFGLQVLVGGDHGWLSSDAGPAGTQHQVIATSGVDLLCRGALPAAMQEELLRMVERDLNDDRPRAERAKHAFLLVTGVLSDMEVVGEGPMVVVSMPGAHTTITVAAPLRMDSAARLEQAVELVRAMDAPALQRRYRDILLGREGAATGLDLDLIDLARRSIGALRYSRYGRHGQPFVVLEVDV